MDGEQARGYGKRFKEAVRTDVSYHVDTAAGPFERTWDWLKTRIVTPVLTIATIGAIGFVAFDGGYRFFIKNDGMKADNKAKIAASSVTGSLGDYWNYVLQPAMNFTGAAVVGIVKIGYYAVVEGVKAGKETLFEDITAPKEIPQLPLQPEQPRKTSEKTTQQQTPKKNDNGYTATVVGPKVPSFALTANDNDFKKMAFPRNVQLVQKAQPRVATSRYS